MASTASDGEREKQQGGRKKAKGLSAPPLRVTGTAAVS